jgi:peptide/nickel transport system ATP-binding protein
VTRPVLEVRTLEVLFRERRLGDGLSFSIGAGRTLALIGESGSGKSLTAAAIMGLLPPGIALSPRSFIAFDGSPLPSEEAKMRALRGRELSMVFQDPMSCLNPFMTAGAQVEETLTRLRMPGKAARRRRIRELFELVELPDPARLALRYPHELSGGQQQRVMLAMALAAEPKLLIADEPTSALDATVQAGILALLQRLQAKLGNAILFITHDLAAAAQLAHAIVVMRAGRAVEQGPTEEILARPSQPYTRELVSTRRMLQVPPAAAPNAEPGPVLVIEDLTYNYPARRLFDHSFRALTSVSLRLAAGETLGILGESGSGKSTLARIVVGLARPVSGEVVLFGESLADRGYKLSRDLRPRCQIVFQNPYGALNPRLTVEQAMLEPLELLRLGGADCRERLEQALEDVNLGAELLRRYPHQLSGGQRQRVSIARALLSNPELLVCDEIVSALDATIQMHILQTLKALQRKRGFAMLFIGHDIEIVRWVSDRIAVMHRGHVVEEGLAGRIVDDPQDAYTRRLVAAMPRPVRANSDPGLAPMTSA